MITGDFLIDLETMKPKVKDGDFVVGDATLQNQKILLLANKNEIKRHPTVCVGAFAFLDDESPDDLVRETRKEFVKDGMDIKDMTVKSDGKLDVDAEYKE